MLLHNFQVHELKIFLAVAYLEILMGDIQSNMLHHHSSATFGNKMELTPFSPVSATSGVAISHSVLISRSLQDIMIETFNICEQHSALMDKSDLVGRGGIDTTALVDKVLGSTDNNMPEDVWCALNIIIQASPMLDLIPGKQDVALLSESLGKLQLLISSSAQTLTASDGSASDQQARSDLADIMQKMGSDIAARIQYISGANVHAEANSILQEMAQGALFMLKDTPVKASDAAGIINKIKVNKCKIADFFDKYSDILSGCIS